MSTTVRAVRIEDFHDYAAIFDQPRVIRGTMQRPFLSHEERRQWLTQALADPNITMLGAHAEGRLVGELSLHVPKNPRARHSASIGMAVHDDFQARGVGSALMAAAVDVADNWLNVVRLELQVFTDNAAAVALYRKFGFETEGTHTMSAFRDGAFVDTYTMARVRRDDARPATE